MTNKRSRSGHPNSQTEADISRSAREEEFAREQDYTQYRNNNMSPNNMSPDERLFWAQISREDQTRKHPKDKELHERRERKEHQERLKLRKARSKKICDAVKIINPGPRLQRKCYRDVREEIIILEMESATSTAWTRENHDAAAKVVEGLKAVRNATKNLPNTESYFLQRWLMKPLSFGESLATLPYGARRSAHGKRRAAEAALRLLRIYGKEPVYGKPGASAGKKGIFLKLAILLAGDAAGMDNHCEDLLRLRKQGKN